MEVLGLQEVELQQRDVRPLPEEQGEGAAVIWWLYAALGAVVAWGWWRLSLRLWPYAPCRWCGGRRGRNAGSTGQRWGRCSRCGGSGQRKRFGARR
jgi:hypothetical protein